MSGLSLSGLASLLLFAVSMTGTPGPNNVMLTASGARFGYKRTLPHILGIMAGGFSLFVALALGFGALFEQVPELQAILKWVGAAYLLYLALKIATAPPPALEHADTARPQSFWQAFAFQYVNPKVWVMGMALMATFLPHEGALWLNAISIALLMELVAFPCISMWAGFGMAISRFLTTPTQWRVFNGVMGLMTAACVLFIVG
ncbi:LysE family translocator [Larsenimonas salina]|uniref:LysE family translocator n=1 Tax=Larsenimonas salina TaxID=1295565 RepID=UPI002072C14A|nr:LysE family translocator [Larsenimonas salina]MCM5705108.1 LysE family translocator [Larsenimonas salina]